MQINLVENNPDFEGKVNIQKRLSKQNKALLNPHKTTLEKIMKDLPFDLYIKQSNNKKIMTFSTNVEGTNIHQLFKRNNNLLEIAGNAISDAKNKSEAYKKLVKADEILWYVKQHMMYVITGRFNEAREASKQIAELGIKDFDIYKSMINFRLIGFPPEANKILLLNSIKYKIYRLFTPKTQEEKQLIKMNKKYLKEMKAQGKEIKPIELEFPRIYH